MILHYGKNFKFSINIKILTGNTDSMNIERDLNKFILQTKKYSLKTEPNSRHKYLKTIPMNFSSLSVCRSCVQLWADKKKKKKLYGPFLWMGFNCLKARATSRRQFTFYH